MPTPHALPGVSKRTFPHWTEAAANLFPIAFAVICLCFGVATLSFDVLERSYLLEHPADCIMARNGSPQSQFLFYGHMLELPLAWVFGLRWLGTSGHRALMLFETLCGAACLYLIFRLVRRWN